MPAAANSLSGVITVISLLKIVIRTNYSTHDKTAGGVCLRLANPETDKVSDSSIL